MNRLVIVGASGHGKVITDIAKKNGYTDIVFLDDNEDKKECSGYPVIGRSTDYTDGDLFIAIGDPDIRRKKMDDLGHCITLIHPNAVIADDVKIGEGSVVMAGVVINPGAKIGRGCIINTCSSVDHDCNLGDFVHASVGAHISGTVNVDAGTWIGAGATVRNNVNICRRCIIGAGAVVVRDIDESGIYVGIPAKKIRDN